MVSAVEYRVDNYSNGLFRVTSVDPTGSATDGATYEMVHLSSFDPAGLATMEYVDAADALRLLDWSGGTMSGDINFDGGGDRYIRVYDGNVLRITENDGVGSRTFFIKMQNTRIKTVVLVLITLYICIT